MTTEVKELIEQTIELTGAAPPALLEADAPVLAAAPDIVAIYLVGLVGGKDVGKSSLVNALVGESISQPTSHGPGTDRVIAYAHESAAEQLRQMLRREVPDRFTIITHSIDRLARQVLLDLPDIDSRFGEHVQITRRMLRHMLFPLWIQSVEKYADRRPQELLAAVAEGNDPVNFIFCLNKADQLDPSASEELRNDYATRISRAIGLAAPPSVFLISAAKPRQFDLPQLRELLSRQKEAEQVKTSLSLADRRQDRSLFGWIHRQGLPERAQQLARLQEDAEEITSARIATPLLDQAIRRMLDDPGQRMALLGPATRLRLSRWPIVNAIDSLFAPMLALVQKNLSVSSTSSADPDAYLDGTSVSAAVQGAFAQLQQLHPQLGTLYHNRKLWESMHADLAAIELRRRFAVATQRQREFILDRADGRFHILLAPLRWLLTIGALLWFPIVQPIASVMLQENTWKMTRRTLEVVVDSLSVTHLLQCVTFLLIWFFILWAILRWRTQRRVNRMIDRWKNADIEDELGLTGQTMQWIDELLEPIRSRREQIETVVKRAEELRSQLSAASPPEVLVAPATGPA
jgi:GTP-binding protein EngB required for normal cell division